MFSHSFIFSSSLSNIASIHPVKFSFQIFFTFKSLIYFSFMPSIYYLTMPHVSFKYLGISRIFIMDVLIYLSGNCIISVIFLFINFYHYFLIWIFLLQNHLPSPPLPATSTHKNIEKHTLKKEIDSACIAACGAMPSYEKKEGQRFKIQRSKCMH